MKGVGPVRVPPGRAGILVLRRRLAVATASADLLARKLTVLSVEADRLATVAAATRRRWCAAAEHAQRLLDRAAQLSGDRGIRLAALPPLARVEMRQTALMGLTYPSGDVCCELPDRPPEAPPPGDASLLQAERAARDAVATAARHAAAARAATIVSREADLTRRRLRALEHHRIPTLREALTLALTRVEEMEAADAVLRRWAVEQQNR